MEAEAYLRSARELPEVIETRMAPAEAPPRSPTKAVVGFLRAGEPIEGHHRQDDQQEARVSPAASGGGDPRGDERAVCQEAGVVPTGGVRRQAETSPTSSWARCG